MILEVALNLPLRQTFDYLAPDGSTPTEGARVWVPFGAQKKCGVITAIKSHSEFKKLKAVEQILDETPWFSQEILKLCYWVAEYYFCGWGEVLNCAIPGGLSVRFQTHYSRLSSESLLPQENSLSSPLQDYLTQRSQWTLQEWKKQKPTKEDELLLQKWLGKKLLLKRLELQGNKIAVKRDKWLRLNPDKHIYENSPNRRKTKRQKILELLRSVDSIALKELKNHVPAPSEALRRLRKEEIVEVFEKRVFRRFLEAGLPPQEDFKELTSEQQEVSRVLQKPLQEPLSTQRYHAFLLHGVTGSGKTEVYLHAVRTARKLNKTCLILVPEIALTPQLVNRFRSRFADEVAVLHSGMDDGERFDEWSRIQEGEASIVVGARSAVFAPLKNLGLIVVDEEHDSSYKQGESPRYQGRDVAVYRAHLNAATIILGSATPSLESAHNVKQNKYALLNLSERVLNASLPQVNLLNMKKSQRQKGSYFFSKVLVEALRQRLQRQEQSILFLNRRGYSPLVQCPECDEILSCRDCSLRLVYHQALERLQCHQCDYSIAMPRSCPECGTFEQPKILGTGTEQIESDLKVIFPHARILRMDRDTLHGKHALSRMQESIQKHEVDIVIGTQLVTKGHDFENVTLVGVILADLSLNLPDFRAGERTFQLLTQVAGRAGRGRKEGEVFIQTYTQEHHSIQCAQTHDFLEFRDAELKSREQRILPPYCSMVCLIFSSHEEEQVALLAQMFMKRLKQAPFKGYTAIGPGEAPIKKIKKRFRWILMLKAKRISLLRKLLHHVFSKPLRMKRGDRISVDIDPYHMM